MASERAAALVDALRDAAYDLGLLTAGQRGPLTEHEGYLVERGAGGDLLAYVAGLEAALAFYGDPATYRPPDLDGAGLPGDAPIDRDEGETARAALALDAEMAGDRAASAPGGRQIAGTATTATGDRAGATGPFPAQSDDSPG